MKAIGYITTFVGTIILSVLWSGYVLSVLWRWFIVPPFNAPTLTVGYAIGIATVVHYMTYQDTKTKSEDDSFPDLLLKGVVVAILRPAFALFFGWIVTLFIS